MALIDVNDVRGEFLADDVPRIAIAIRAAADVQSGTLTQRVEHRALVFPDRASVDAAQFAGLRRQVSRKERAEIAFTDEADARGILFRGDRQSGGIG